MKANNSMEKNRGKNKALTPTDDTVTGVKKISLQKPE